MNKYFKGLLIISFAGTMFSCHSKIKDFQDAGRLPVIFPDYSGIVIPPNIAPLNFKIQEEGSEYEVSAYLNDEVRLRVRSHNPTIQFDIGKWHKLINEGAGSYLYFEIFVKDMQGTWQKFQTIRNEISKNKIDNQLAYRLINTGYVFWNNLGIYQRSLETFDEKPILENKSFDYGCLNCHSFCKNNPENMLIHIRAVHSGTIISKGSELIKVDTKNKYTLNAGVYPSWHPDGRHIAFSVNNINQHFCNGETRIEVSDEFSDLVVYNIDNNTITTCPEISTNNRENLPTWSPDGRFLYFTSAPPASNLDNRVYTKYELLRIGFNSVDATWGEIDTVLSTENFGKSISFPRISPDGRFLMFSASKFGYFTIHHSDTDLYLLNLETGKFNKMEINSSQTDSYHSFSSEGKWFVFSSKRMDGLFTRPFFSYLDENGNASKPFVLPQKDPEFYNRFIQNYNIPELITGEVKPSALEIRDKVLKEAIPAKIDPSVDTTYMKKHLTLSSK